MKENYLVSLVVPVFNEQDTIETFVRTIEQKLAPVISHLEIVFVDDGSRDHTATIIKTLAQTRPRISLVRLSRNFGKEAALSAALDLVQGDAMIPIDVDLQDPPELILEFIRIWHDEGIDNVYGIRTGNTGDTETKRLTSKSFYYIFNKVSYQVRIPANVGDFRLIDRRVIDTLKQFPERNRFMKGLFVWPGFSSKGVAYRRSPRTAGHTKWNYWQLWNFALDGIVAFSSLPLRVWSYIGVCIAVLAMIYMLWIVIETTVLEVSVPGYSPVLSVLLFLGSVQLISIGVLGEYLARLSMEVKHRPVYVVEKISGPLAASQPRGMHCSVCGIIHNEDDSEERGGHDGGSNGSGSADGYRSGSTDCSHDMGSRP